MAKMQFTKPGGEALAAGQVQTPVVDVQATVVTAAEPAQPAQPTAQTVTATQEAPASQLPAVVPPQPVARPSMFQDDEPLDPRDMVLANLKIVQKVGDLSNVFQGGTILLGTQSGNLVLTKAPVEKQESGQIRFLVLGLLPKKYMEKVQFGTQGANEFDNEEDVVKAGGTLDYNESVKCGKPLYQTYIQAILLVEQPEGVDAASFPIEVGGKRYVIARYGMKGTSYTHAAKHILTARRMGHLRQGWKAGFWSIASVLKSFNGQYYYAPVVRPAEATTDAFRAELAQALDF